MNGGGSRYTLNRTSVAWHQPSGLLPQKARRSSTPLVCLKISGLRGFSNEQKVNFAIPNGSAGSGLTYLTGPNNSGKSTIIEAFRAYLWRHNRPSYHEGMRNRKLDFVRIEFHYADRLHWIASLRKGASETEGNITPGSGVPYVIPSRRYFAPYFMRQAQLYDRENFLLATGDATYHQQRGPSLNQFEQRLFDIDRDEQKRSAFNRIIGQIVPQGVNWSIDQSESSQWVLRFLGNEKAHSAEGVGEGIASLFTLVAAFYDSKPGDIIVIDEPELSLHPSYQKRLSRVITDFAADRQIIISTHSPYMIEIDAIRNGAALCRAWERERGTEVCQLTEMSRTAWEKLTTFDIYNPHRFGLDAKEVFFLEDGLIVVEGQEDVVMMPRLFSQVGIEPKAEFFGWGAAGSDNIRYVLRILTELGFEHVAAIYDGDKEEDMIVAKSEYGQYRIDCLPAPDIRAKDQKPAKAKEGLLSNKGLLPPESSEIAGEFVKKLASYFQSA